MGQGRNLSSLIDSADAKRKLKAPASEVVAVDSWWMHALTYGGPNAHTDSATPYRDDIAYGSIAGDDSSDLEFGPLHGISLYGATLFLQRPSRFPFHQLERRAGAAGSVGPLLGGPGDYSDSLVPIWSALIPGAGPVASRIVHASHRRFLMNRETQTVVTQWLNSAALPLGKDLQAKWNTPIESRGGRKRWLFQDGEMAPRNLAGLYGRVDGAGRILPTALHPDQTLSVRDEGDAALMVEWPLPAGGRLRGVTVYARAGGALRRVREVSAKPIDGRLCCRIEGVPRDRSWSVVAEAVIDNLPDVPVVLRSAVIPLAVTEPALLRLSGAPAP